MAAALLWAACLVPPHSWLDLASRWWQVGLTAAGVGLSAWVVGRVAAEGWMWFGRWTFLASAGLLRVIAPVAVCDPDRFLLGTPAFVVEISPACSGYEGMGLTAVFVGTYVFLFRHTLRFPAAFILIPAGIALAWLMNAVRIAALVAVGTWISPSVARGGFHSQAGWLAFLAVSLGLVTVTQRSRLFLLDPRRPVRGIDPTVAYLGPLLVLVATQMVTAALSAGIDLLYPMRVVTVLVALWYFWSAYAGLRASVSPVAVAWGVAAFVIWLALERRASPDAVAALPAALQSFPDGFVAAWLAFRVIGSVVLVPLAEELGFRGYLLRRLQAADFRQIPPGRFTWLSFIASSVLFGALHGRWLAGTLAGMMYALALYRRGALADAVVAHAVTNALIAVAVLGFGAWQLWS